MADVPARLGTASAELGVMGDLLDGTRRLAMPHLAADLASMMDKTWAQQLELTRLLGEELQDLAGAVRLAAQRYTEADQAF